MLYNVAWEYPKNRSCPARARFVFYNSSYIERAKCLSFLYLYSIKTPAKMSNNRDFHDFFPTDNSSSTNSNMILSPVNLWLESRTTRCGMLRVQALGLHSVWLVQCCRWFWRWWWFFSLVFDGFVKVLNKKQPEGCLVSCDINIIIDYLQILDGMINYEHILYITL